MVAVSRDWLAALAISGVSACAAPQQPGIARTSYVTMSTVDGAVIGGGLAVGACSLVGGEHTPTRLAVACGTIGGVVGGIAVLAGTLRADEEPDLARWITVPVLPALIVVGGLWRIVERAQR